MKKGLVYYKDKLAGEITETDDGDFIFLYSKSYLEDMAALPLSYSLPLQREAFSSQYINGFFDGLLPEGWILGLASTYWKYHPIRDRFNLLLKTCQDPIGAVSIVQSSTEELREEPSPDIYKERKITNPGKCLYCYEKLENGEFHGKCSTQFFKSNNPPSIYLNREILNELSLLNIKNGNTIPGVQNKISLSLQKNGKSERLTLTHLSGNYILKPKGKIPHIPENEDLILKLARSYGMSTAESTLVFLENNELALLIKRFDREDDGSKIHMEDFCQILDQITERKYIGSYQKVAKTLRKYCAENAPADQLLRLFELIVFSFIVGNSDLHLKNISVLLNEKASLSPAFDLLSFEIYQEDFKEHDNEQMALSINGKKNKLNREDFDKLANIFEIKEKVRNYIYKKFESKVSLWDELISKSFLPENKKEKLKSLIRERMSLFIGP